MARNHGRRPTGTGSSSPARARSTTGAGTRSTRSGSPRGPPCSSSDMSGGAGGRAGRRSQAGPHLGLAHPPQLDRRRRRRPAQHRRPRFRRGLRDQRRPRRPGRGPRSPRPRHGPASTRGPARRRRPSRLRRLRPRESLESALRTVGSRGRCDPRARLASTTAIKGCGRRRRRPGGPELGGRGGRPGGRDVGRGSGPRASARAQALRDLAPRPTVRRCCCRPPAPGRCTREAPPLNSVGHRMPGASAMHLRRHNLGLWVDNIGGATERARSWPCSTSRRPRGPTKKEAR